MNKMILLIRSLEFAIVSAGSGKGFKIILLGKKKNIQSHHLQNDFNWNSLGIYEFHSTRIKTSSTRCSSTAFLPCAGKEPTHLSFARLTYESCSTLIKPSVKVKYKEHLPPGPKNSLSQKCAENVNRWARLPRATALFIYLIINAFFFHPFSS